MTSDQITVIDAPSDVDPSDATSYFPEPASLIKWSDARREVPGKYRLEIADGTTVACLTDVLQDDYGTPYLRVANAVCGADSFWPDFASDKDKRTLGQYAGMTVAITATIARRTDDYSCHGSRYAIEPGFVLAALPHNPSTNELRRMKPGTQFIIQGVFQEYFERTFNQDTTSPMSSDTKGYLVIRTSQDEVITIHSLRPHMHEPTYTDGVLENLKHKPMIPGETIRITGFIAERGTSRYALPAGTPSVGYNQPYLLVPDPQRQADYDQLRQETANNLHYLLELIDDHDWQAARDMFAMLRKTELTNDEARQLLADIEMMPETERPVYHEHRSTADDLLKAFGTDPESLNREDFLAFAMDVITGVRENPKDKDRRIDQSYLFWFWFDEHKVLTEADLDNLLDIGLRVRLKRLELCSDEHASYWDDQYLLKKMIESNSYTDGYPAQKLVQRIMEVTDRCIEQRYFGHASDTHENHQCPRRMDGILRKCIGTLVEIYTKHARRMSQTAFVSMQDFLNDRESQLTKLGADRQTLSEFRIRR